VLLATTTIIFINKNNTKAKAIEEKNNTIQSYFTTINNLRNENSLYKEQVESKRKQVDKLEKEIIDITTNKDILSRLEFTTPENTMAVNVKVKTIIDKDGNPKVTASIRRYVNGKYQEVPVTAKLR
jgi:phage shock protein A